MKDSKYIAILVKGLDHWLWFEKAKVKKDDFHFTGIEGWGKDGALTEIIIKNTEIIGNIESDELQY